MTNVTHSLNAPKPTFLRQAGLVIVLAACFGCLLAAAQIVLSPVIQANKMNEALQHVPDLLGNASASSSASDFDIERLAVAGSRKTYVVYRASRQGVPAGWVVVTSGQGYGSMIELLIGLNPQLDTITGLYVLDQKETPGLGNKISEDAWRRQFVGKSALHPVEVAGKKQKRGPKEAQNGANTIDAITGATISSRSVCRITNAAIAELRTPLLQKR